MNPLQSPAGVLPTIPLFSHTENFEPVPILIPENLDATKTPLFAASKENEPQLICAFPRKLTRETTFSIYFDKFAIQPAVVAAHFDLHRIITQIPNHHKFKCAFQFDRKKQNATREKIDRKNPFTAVAKLIRKNKKLRFEVPVETDARRNSTALNSELSFKTLISVDSNGLLNWDIKTFQEFPQLSTPGIEYESPKDNFRLDRSVYGIISVRAINSTGHKSYFKKLKAIHPSIEIIPKFD